MTQAILMPENATVVELLHEAGADLSLPDGKGHSALRLACLSRNLVAAALLLRFGADATPRRSMGRGGWRGWPASEHEHARWMLESYVQTGQLCVLADPRPGLGDPGAVAAPAVSPPLHGGAAGAGTAGIAGIAGTCREAGQQGALGAWVRAQNRVMGACFFRICI